MRRKTLENIKQLKKCTIKYIKTFAKWIFLAVLVGVIGGALCSVFHKCLEFVTETRENNKWLILFLPVAGAVITAIYNLFKNKGDLSTNGIIDAAAGDKKVPLVLAPLIFVGTIITHLFGGSAGREGAALQLGGSIGWNIGRLFRLNKSDLHTIVVTGCSSFFSAMFGAPLTAAIFALEFVRVGNICNCALLPCVISSVVSHKIASMMGASGIRYNVAVPDCSVEVLSKTIVLTLLCALVSILFCVAIKKTKTLLHKITPNEYIASLLGALIIVVLTVILGTTDYNGAGMSVISRAMEGKSEAFAFLLKIIFTAITIAAGFKGGEIVPTLFIGATFGCVAGGLLGIEPGFAASVGFVALFCGVTNCPLASIALSIDVFGADGILIYAVAVAVSFMMSGNFGLYKSQKIMFSKIENEEIE